ncbi:MAG: hypothetical protein MZU91_02750 [Desulfosudis oleivorans]|nr:hypothetical protein [Desulfosudis oleivorans]
MTQATPASRTSRCHRLRRSGRHLRHDPADLYAFGDIDDPDPFFVFQLQGRVHLQSTGLH